MKIFSGFIKFYPIGGQNPPFPVTGDGWKTLPTAGSPAEGLPLVGNGRDFVRKPFN